LISREVDEFESVEGVGDHAEKIVVSSEGDSPNAEGNLSI